MLIFHILLLLPHHYVRDDGYDVVRVHVVILHVHGGHALRVHGHVPHDDVLHARPYPHYHLFQALLSNLLNLQLFQSQSFLYLIFL